ncbi:hypothetical protein IMY05_C4902000300 [Salix suchowensis]|nr:hypothetical protein IMY05_C4902000300 [Salix suchowensis]
MLLRHSTALLVYGGTATAMLSTLVVVKASMPDDTRMVVVEKFESLIWLQSRSFAYYITPCAILTTHPASSLRHGPFTTTKVEAVTVTVPPVNEEGPTKRLLGNSLAEGD